MNISKTKYMTNLVPSEQIFVGDKEEALVNKYNYLGHEIQISRDNQTCEKKEELHYPGQPIESLRTSLKTTCHNI